MNTMLHAVAASVAQSLATAEIIDGSAFISTPLMYPGGASVVVQMTQHGSRYFISDAGLGRREAHLIGGDRLFLRIGQEVAYRFGVAFDKDSFFSAETEQDDLVVAVAVVANASRTAVEQTAYRVADRAASDSRLVMKDKLARAFDPSKVAMEYEFRGASSDPWIFDAAIVSDAHLTLFQMVTPAPQSVHSAVVRFVDVADMGLSTAPHLVAVLEDRPNTKHLRLVERSASTIDLQSEVPVWQRAAA